MLTLDLTHPKAGELLSQSFHASADRLDLAALAVAALEYPSLDIERTQDHLDRLARRVVAARTDSWTPVDQVEALRTVLVEEEDLRGNEARYHDPENSFINRVLDQKRGIPISVSVVWLEVARRAGIPLYGVGFPGHFLVAIGRDGGRLVVDPFNGGKLLSTEDCEALLRQVVPEARLSDALFAPTPVREIVWRMLMNLKRIYLSRGDQLRAIKVQDLLLQLAPDHPLELRTRAALLSSLGAYRAALSDLERVMQLGPAPDAAALKSAAKALKERLQFVN
ncbi:MAG: transglutaminase-like domain-containing protein [Myxococcaceae bacterium]